MKKRLFLFLILTCCFAMSAQTINKTYHFDEPKINKIRGYDQIELDGCMISAEAGNPSLPYQSVSILLPQGFEAQNIRVELSDFVEMEGSYNLYPYQSARPYSQKTYEGFLKNEELYSSKQVYPSECNGIITTNYMNGYAFAFSAFTPVQYIPASGKVFYATTATVSIDMTAAKTDKSAMLSNNYLVRERVIAMAQNPEMIDSYSINDKSLNGYELLVITPEEYVEDFDSYIDLYTYKGLRTRVVSVESIYDTTEGIDNQDKIRNFIINEYQNNDIMMVLLGGDVALIPYRGFYCDVLSGGSHQTDYNIPADLYYAALDGTWDDNGNGIWGEIGEDDLLPEIGIARFPFNNKEQLNNMMNKTIMYQQVPVRGEFRNVILAGESLYDYPRTLGSDYLELLVGNHDDNGYSTVGIPEDYNFTRLYHEDGNWSPALLADAINSGTGYVHHAGHANADYVAGWNGMSITDSYFSGSNGIDHNYTFFHTHGCDCGDFASNCILEKMVTISNFAVATIGNSRYGWFNEGQTEGPACHLQREMTDAFWNDRIPYLGMAMTDAKCQTAPWVNAPGQWEEGALRWNFYDLNIMGDVAVSPWHDEPFNATVSYTPALLQGDESMNINVSNKGIPLKNYRCLLYHYDTMLGYAITDENGNATIEFAEPINFVDQVRLNVNGMNSFPVETTIECISDDSPFVYPDVITVVDNNGNGNGEIDYGETVTLKIDYRNFGREATSDIDTYLSCCNAGYIIVSDNEAHIDHIDALGVVTINDAFEFTVVDDIPDGTVLNLGITISDGTGYWHKSFGLEVNAPDLEITSVSYNDENGDGIIEAGETVIFTIDGINNGGSDSGSAVLKTSTENELIHVINNEIELNAIEAGGSFSTDIEIYFDELITDGSFYNINFNLTAGNYDCHYNYQGTISYILESFETGDFSYLNWEFAYDNDWTITDEDAYDGSYCARSGDIDDNEMSSMIIYFDAKQDGELSFYFKTSTEEGKDFLVLYVNDELINRWSGENDWQPFNMSIPVGTYKVEWRYDKSPTGSYGDDRVMVDAIRLPINSLIMTDNVELTDNELTFDIYPNPNNGKFNIELPEGNFSLKVFDITGRLIKNDDDIGGICQIDMSALNNGLYIIQIMDSERCSIRKIIINK